MPFRVHLGIAVAFFASALAPALVAFLLLPVFGDLRGATLIAAAIFIVASVHSLLFGTVAFSIGRRRQRITFWNCVLIGFAIGAVPLGILTLVPLFSADNMGQDGFATVVNHVPTLMGWLFHLGASSIFGGFGALGGFAFWAVLRAGKMLPWVNAPVPK